MSHLDFSLAEPSLFALAMIKEAGPHFREALIKELISKAQNYEVKDGGRFEQELSAHILCYLMAVNSDFFKFDLMRDAFTASCSRQLYPAQAVLLQEMMLKNEFFRLYPRNEFKKALSIEKKGDSYVFSNQPNFFFYQTFCEKKRESIENLTDFFFLCSRAQFDSWINKDFENAKKCLKKAYNSTICNFNRESFDINCNGEDAVKNIYGLQLWLYGLTNIYTPTSGHGAGAFITQEVLGISSAEEQEKALHHILKVVFFSEFFQKMQNPYYPSNTKEMSLVCGAFRFFNCFDLGCCELDTTDDSWANDIKQYLDWMAKEPKTSRYYWFQRRLLSYYKNKADFEDEAECEYMSTEFLKYDNFPNSYQKFKKEPRRLNQ